MPTQKKIAAFIDALLEQPRAPEEQVIVLRRCLEFHTLGHPWADEEFVDSALGNIAREYNLEWTEGEDDDEDSA